MLSARVSEVPRRPRRVRGAISAGLVNRESAWRARADTAGDTSALWGQLAPECAALRLGRGLPHVPMVETAEAR
jgi:hypothetical protein